MKLMEFTAYGVADEYAAITINLDNVNAIYASEANAKKGNTTINYSNGTWTYLRES
jgi:hypothetical protein